MSACCVRACVRVCLLCVQAGNLDGFDWSGLKLLERMYLTSNKLLGGVFPKLSSANLSHYHVGETAFEGALPNLARFHKLTEIHIYNTPNAALGPMPLWLSRKALPDIIKTTRGSGVYGLVIDKAQRTGVKDANACAKLMVANSSGYTCACDSNYTGRRCSTCKTCRVGLGCGATPGSCIVYPDITSTYASDTTSLNLADSNLVGELPDMSLLPNLVALDISGNPHLKSGAVWGWVQTILDRGGTVKLSNTNRVVAAGLSQLLVACPLAQCHHRALPCQPPVAPVRAGLVGCARCDHCAHAACHNGTLASLVRAHTSTAIGSVHNHLVPFNSQWQCPPTPAEKVNVVCVCVCVCARAFVSRRACRVQTHGRTLPRRTKQAVFVLCV